MLYIRILLSVLFIRKDSARKAPLYKPEILVERFEKLAVDVEIMSNCWSDHLKHVDCVLSQLD